MEIAQNKKNKKSGRIILVSLGPGELARRGGNWQDNSVVELDKRS